jgi:rhodanese-related sulfurtransferase
LNKQYLSGLAAILIALLIIAPGIAGAAPKIICNIHGVYQNVSVSEAKKMLENKDVFLLDVRTPAEYNYSHIEGAILIPLKNVSAHDPINLSEDQLLAKRLNELPKNKHTRILVYCKVGGRGATASQMIADAGYKRVYNMKNMKGDMKGGIDAWVSAGYPVVVDFTKWTDNYPHT